MALAEAARDAAAHLASAPAGTLHILAQEDADGIAGAAILVRALMRQQRAFRVRFHRACEPYDDIDASEVPQVLLGIDPAITPWPQDWRPIMAVWDEPSPRRDAQPYDLNPRSLGEAPGSASTASTVLAAAVALDAANWDQAPLALAGALSQDQLRPGAGGWNDTALRHAQREGRLVAQTGLALPDGPLAESLAVGIAGLGPLGIASVDEAHRFLERHGLPPHATPHELSSRDRQTLASALLYAHLRHSHAAPAHAVRLFAPTLAAPPPLDLPLANLARLLESAAQEDEASTALAWLLGDESVRNELDQAQARAEAEIETTLRAMAPPSDDGPLIRDVPRIQALDTLARRLTRSGPPRRPVALMSHHDDRTIACLRLPDAAVTQGRDAVAILGRCVAPVGGTAGGHAHHAVGQVPAAQHHALADRLRHELEGVMQAVVP